MSELVKTGVRDIDSVCWFLMRQIPSGDLSPKAISLTDSLLQIFIDNKSVFARTLYFHEINTKFSFLFFLGIN